MHYKFPLVAVAATIALSACSSSLTSTLPPSGPTVTQAKNVVAKYLDYQNRITNNTLTTTTPTGTATMAGYMSIDNVDPNDPTTRAIGDLNMTADFNANTLTGKADNFGAYKGDPTTSSFAKAGNTSGSLALNGNVSGSGMTATAKGTLSADNSADFNLNLKGSFYDDAGLLTAVGDGSGTMIENGTTRNVTSKFYATKK